MESEAVRVVVESAPPPPWHVYVYWWSQVGLMLIAAATAAVGYIHLNHIRATRDDTLQIARANFLLELDRRWDSQEMQDARKEWNAMMDEAKSKVAKDHPLANDGERTKRLRVALKNELARLRKEELEGYAKILRICGFFETAGLMIKKDYVPQEDIELLFKGPISCLDLCFADHIAEREKETGMLKGLYEHALYLHSLVAGNEPAR